MSWTRTVDEDPVSLTRAVMHYDSATDTVTNVEYQNVKSIADIAEEHRKNQPSWRPWKGDFHLVGVLPNIVYWKLWKEQRLPSQDLAAFKKWWNTEGQHTWNTKTGRL